MGNTMTQRAWVFFLGILWATGTVALPATADAAGACEQAERAFAAAEDGPWAERATRAERLRACLRPGTPRYQATYVHELDALVRAERYADVDRVLAALHRDPAVTDPTVTSRAAERAGRAAAAREDRVDAVHQYRTAILHDAARPPAEQAALRQALAEQYRSLGRHAAAAAALEDALAVGATLSPHRNAHLHLLASDVALAQALAMPAAARDLSTGRTHHQTAARILSEDADPAVRSQLAQQRALYLLLNGQLDPARTAATEAVRLADAADHARLQAAARVVQARLDLCDGHVDAAVRRLDRATAILQRHDAGPLPSVLSVRLQAAAHDNRKAAAHDALRELAAMEGPGVAPHRRQASLTYVNAFATPEPGRLWWGMLLGMGVALTVVGGVAGWRTLRRSPDVAHSKDALDAALRSALPAKPKNSARPTAADAFGPEASGAPDGAQPRREGNRPRPASSPASRKDRDAMAGIAGWTEDGLPTQATDAPETDAPETDAPETDAPETDAPKRGDAAGRTGPAPASDDASASEGGAEAPVPGLTDAQRMRLFDTWGIPEDGAEARVSLPLYLQSGEYVGYRAVPLPLLRDVLDRSLCLTVDRGAYRLLFVQNIPSHELLLSINEQDGIQLAHVNTPIHGFPLAYVDRSVCGVGDDHEDEGGGA